MLSIKIYKISKMLLAYSGYIRKTLKSVYQNEYLKDINKKYDDLTDEDKNKLQEYLKNKLDNIEKEINDISYNFKAKQDINSWIANQIKLKNIILPEDKEKTKELLNNYYNFALKSINFKGSKNILDYDSDSDLYDDITKFFEKDRKKNKEYNLKDQDILFKNGEFLCFKTDNFEKSKDILSDTLWCIGQSKSYFDEYIKNGSKYYYVIMKAGLPFCCINFQAGECRNRNDKMFDLKDINDSFYNIVKSAAEDGGPIDYSFFSGEKQNLTFDDLNCFMPFITYKLNKNKILYMKDHNYESYDFLYKNGDLFLEDDVDQLIYETDYSNLTKMIISQRIKNDENIKKIIAKLFSDKRFFELALLIKNKIIIKKNEINLIANDIAKHNISSILIEQIFTLNMIEFNDTIINDLLKYKKADELFQLLYLSNFTQTNDFLKKLIGLCIEDKKYNYVINIYDRYSPRINELGKKDFEDSLKIFFSNTEIKLFENRILESILTDEKLCYKDSLDIILNCSKTNKKIIDILIDCIYLMKNDTMKQHIVNFFIENNPTPLIRLILDHKINDKNIINDIVNRLIKIKDFTGLSELIDNAFINKEKGKEVLDDIIDDVIKNNNLTHLKYIIKIISLLEEYGKNIRQDKIKKLIKVYVDNGLELYANDIIINIGGNNEQDNADYLLNLLIDKKSKENIILEFVHTFYYLFFKEKDLERLIDFAIHNNFVDILYAIEEDKAIFKYTRLIDKIFNYAVKNKNEILSELFIDNISDSLKNKLN